MKIALTGATGFLGRHVAVRLANAGHEVVAISRRGWESKSDETVDGSGAIHSFQGDVTSQSEMEKAFGGCDVVVHAAGRVSHEPEDAGETWAVHFDGTETVVAAACAAGVGRFVHVSSSGTVAVSKDASFVGTEKSPDVLPVIQEWPYYRAKYFSEQVVLAANGVASGDGTLTVVCLNPSLLLGPGDELGGGSTQCVQTFLDGSIPFPPPGSLSFVDVRDVAVAVEQALENGEPGTRYLLGSANLGFRDFYDKLARITGKKAPVGTLPRMTRSMLKFLPGLGKEDGIGVGTKITRSELELACHNWSVDSARAEEGLDWHPRDPLDTLSDTVHDIQQRRMQHFRMR